VTRNLFESRFANKTVAFLGDTVMLNLWHFMLCDLSRLGMGPVPVSGYDEKDTLEKAAQLDYGRDRVEEFWRSWFDAPWENYHAVGFGVQAMLVPPTGTLVVYVSATSGAEVAIIAPLVDVLVASIRFHVDPAVKGSLRNLAAVDAMIDALAKAAHSTKIFWRETSAIHKPGPDCVCLPSGDSASEEAELNQAANNQLLEYKAGITVIPFYNTTAAMHFAHMQNSTSLASSCDCKQWCYSPQLARIFS
jgi:hypothetical protein